MAQLEFDGKVILITGAGSGIGRSHSTHLAQLGATVIVHDIEPERVRKVVDNIAAAGGHAVEMISDVRDTLTSVRRSSAWESSWAA
jgi:NAD(P)-dependent dehydrogenase (short-subunit alcohol dehydrogenase family)